MMKKIFSNNLMFLGNDLKGGLVIKNTTINNLENNNLTNNSTI
jgi:hypothetical protein